MALILWIAEHHYDCQDLLDYVDDIFSDEFDDNMTLYPRYQEIMPSKQVRLLTCMDDINVPHRRPKQTWSEAEPVIGLEVNGNLLMITMPPEAKTALLTALDDFTRTRSRAARNTQTLRRCQAIAGHVNWALNVFPLLKPGLCRLYDKLSTSDHGFQLRVQW